MKTKPSNSKPETRNAKLISSRDNPLLRQARAVRDGKDDQLIFVEGLRLCEEALHSGLTIQAVIYSEEITRKERAATLLDEVSKVCDRFGEVDESLLGSVSYTKAPQGMIVLVERPASGQARLETHNSRPHLLLVIEAINNPVNVGAILRSGEAAGATGVIATAKTADPFSPKALRGAMGSAFRLPIWIGPSYKDALEWCAKHKIKTVCADLAGTMLHTKIDWREPRALIVGPESTGLSSEQVRMADETVKIPMQGNVESLNVGAAVAVLLYEAARQRDERRGE